MPDRKVKPPLDFGGMTPVSNGSLKTLLCTVIVELLEETESGSAGKQLDKGYRGRRCGRTLPPDEPFFLCQHIRESYLLMFLGRRFSTRMAKWLRASCWW